MDWGSDQTCKNCQNNMIIIIIIIYLSRTTQNNKQANIRSTPINNLNLNVIMLADKQLWKVNLDSIPHATWHVIKLCVHRYVAVMKEIIYTNFETIIINSDTDI